MSLLSTYFGEIVMWGGSILRIVGYLVLALALLTWCQRLRHWSLGVLALTFLIFAGLNATSLVMWAAKIGSSGPSSGLREAWMFLQQIASLAGNVLLVVGAFGFLLAAKQLLSVRDETDALPPTLPQQPT